MLEETIKISKNSCLTNLQQTLEGNVYLSGIGIHTGQSVNVCLKPAEEDVGIVFKRVDINNLLIPATIKYVQGTSRSTSIGIDNIRIATVEHFLATIRAYGIDNLYVEITGDELPIGNGSADHFVNMIEQSHVVKQKHARNVIKIKEPVYLSMGDTHLVALPDDEFKISYTIDYPSAPIIGSQFFSITISPETFKKEIAPCRTFCLYEEVATLQNQGLAQGGSLKNAIIIDKNKLLNDEGLKFHNEMVRHKILDLIGDLSLVGYTFCAHVIAIRSGHSANVAFANKILEYILNMEKN